MHEEPVHELPAVASMCTEDADNMLAQAASGAGSGQRSNEDGQRAQLPAWLTVYMAQALFSPDGKVRVLLNDEIKGQGLCLLQGSIQKEGEPLYSNDLFELPDELWIAGTSP